MSHRYYAHHKNEIHKTTYLFTGKRGGAFGSMSDLELQRSFGSGQDPRPPKPEPGDTYIMLGVITGLILGGVLGGIIASLNNLHVVTVIFCVFGGLIAGGLLGTIIGIYVKRRIVKDKSE